MIKKLKPSILIWLLFVGFGSILTYSTDIIFYLFNFLYIGSFLAIGTYLFEAGWKYARIVVQFGVGSYILVYLGVILRENMQLSGFFYYLFLGVFQAATIHYFIAKIVGPFIFGRGFCGYACWTTMVLDLLPFKIPRSHDRMPKLGLVRYLVFAVTMGSVAALFIFKVQDLESIIFALFIVGNILYYAVGIAFSFKDNRAFCKYICPITTFLKPCSYFSITRIKKDDGKCIDCKKCLQACPMDVDMLDNKRSRTNGTECILCGMCVKTCPTKALKM